MLVKHLCVEIRSVLASFCGSTSFVLVIGCSGSSSSRTGFSVPDSIRMFPVHSGGSIEVYCKFIISMCCADFPEFGIPSEYDAVVSCTL